MVSKPVFALMISVLLVGALAYASIAADYYVDANVGSDSNTGSQGSPWLTLTHALDSVEVTPATIHVAAGAYTPSANAESFPLSMKSYVSLVGDGPETTILDAEESAPHVIYCSSVNQLTIEGMTITGGEGKEGGGICCSWGSSPTIENNTITGNWADDGAGIYCHWGSSPTIENNTITGNWADHYGGGIYCKDSSPAITNNTITGNSANASFGGGICFVGNSSPTIEDNTIRGNSARYSSGGGIFSSGNSPTIANNTIESNSAGYKGGGICCSSNSPMIANNTITGNSADDGGGIWCSGNSPMIVSNTITGNRAYTDKGGGICSEDSSATIENNRIESNSAAYRGGGIYCYGNSPTIANNTIGSNSAGYYGGGGIFCYANSPTIANNTIESNSAGYYGGGGIFCTSGCSPTIADCIIWDNGDDLCQCSPTYCCIEDEDEGEGNIHQDPMFVCGPFGDYYLDPDSPCINAGSRSASDAGLSDRTTQANETPDTGMLDIGYHYPIWAGENRVPFEPSNPSPEDGASDQPISLTLTWDGGDPDEGDTVTYDVYFGESEEPPLEYEGLSEASQAISGLARGTEYHWKVVAEDSQGEVTESPVWSFTTGGTAPDVSIRVESASFLSDTVLSAHLAIFVEVEKGEESVTEVEVGITTGRATEWYPAVQDKYLTIRWKWIFDTASITGGVDGEVGLQARAMGGEEVLAQTDAITLTLHNERVVDSGFTVGLDGFPHGNSSSPPKCLGMAGYSKWLYKQSGGAGWNTDFLHLWDAHASSAGVHGLGLGSLVHIHHDFRR